ncbi:MAG: thrombospondin type 3 repeat-containing protein [Candidatus Zixiibacteriota bacterium]
MKQRLMVVLLTGCLIAGLVAASIVEAVAGQPKTGDASAMNAKGLRLDAIPSHKIEGGPITLPVGLPLEQVPKADAEAAKQLAPHQGGENIASATVIPSMPYSDTGHTTGYLNDYQEDVCRGAGISTQPDVVYSYTPSSAELVTIDLCASSYNTNVWVYRTTADTLVGCNRFNSTLCVGLRSAMADVRMEAGITYYIVVDGDHIAPGSGDYSMSCTAVPAPPMVPAQTIHPTLGDAGNGSLMLGYEEKLQNDTTLVWAGSGDDGMTFPTAGAFTATGYPTYPAIDFWGHDSIFYGTEVGPTQESGGGRVYLTEIPNATNGTIWSQSYWNWNTYGWNTARAADVACDTSGEFNQRPGEYAFGIVSWVANTTYPTPDLLAAPHILYEIDTTIAGYATISWYSVSGCKTTAVDIDKVTTLLYAVYDRLNDTTNLWELLIRRDLFSNFNDETQSGMVMYEMGVDTSVTNPAVAAHGGQIAIVTELGTTAAPNDHDIICWHHTGSFYDSLETSIVAATAADERYPRISHVGGNKFACTYISGNQLYLSTSCDGGATWSMPAVVSGADIVVPEYHASDIGEQGQKVIWEYYSNLPTDSAISLHFAETNIAFDTDGDCVDDPSDNCPAMANPLQEDGDADGVGDLCDNCPVDPNPNQADTDQDGIGDVCDGCCLVLTGNVDGDTGDLVDISDLSAMVDYLFFSGSISSCFEENDVDKSASVDISDLSVLVDFLFFSGALPTCP